MVRMSVLADCLKTISNAEKRGRRQVMVRPSSKVVIKFLRCMQQHGKFSPSVDPVLLPVCIPCPSLVHTTNNKNNNNNNASRIAIDRSQRLYTVHYTAHCTARYILDSYGVGCTVFR
uniref:40S ribosomal protein S15a n=1 Tax=Pseudo-nitzschia australis TaxID=44445 RepID=A0A6V0BGU3_9STRA